MKFRGRWLGALVAQSTTAVGATVTFTAAASGTPAPSVLWQTSSDGGVTWKPIVGATSGTLTLRGVQVAQTGSRYRAVFTDPVGTVTSNVAVLTVHT